MAHLDLATRNDTRPLIELETNGTISDDQAKIHFMKYVLDNLRTFTHSELRPFIEWRENGECKRNA